VSLTTSIAGSAIPREKPYKLLDGNGLVLLIQPSGSKLWRQRYRFGGREKMLSLGIYPTISLRRARQRSHNARRLLESGIDPSVARATGLMTTTACN